MMSDYATSPTRTYRPRLHQSRKLRSYLRGGGLSYAAGGSKFGAQLERAANQAIGTRCCPRCRGTGAAPPHRELTEAGLAFFAEAGLDADEARELVEQLAPTEVCTRCRGTRVVTCRRGKTASWVTVNVMGSTAKGGTSGHQMDDSALELLGRVARWLRDVGRRDMAAAAALQAYCHPEGTGDLLVVWHLTSAGKTLLHRRGASRQHPLVWLQEQRRMKVAGFTDHIRDRLIEAADQQARTLIERAARIWNDVVPDPETQVVEDFWREVEQG